MAIPDIPTWVKEEMAKLDYQRREAFKVKHEADTEKFKISFKLTKEHFNVLFHLNVLQHSCFIFLLIIMFTRKA